MQGMPSEPDLTLSLRDRLESGRLRAAPDEDDRSILDAVARLKDQIRETEQSLRVRHGDLSGALRAPSGSLLLSLQCKGARAAQMRLRAPHE